LISQREWIVGTDIVSFYILYTPVATVSVLDITDYNDRQLTNIVNANKQELQELKAKHEQEIEKLKVGEVSCYTIYFVRTGVTIYFGYFSLKFMSFVALNHV